MQQYGGGVADSNVAPGVTEAAQRTSGGRLRASSSVFISLGGTIICLLLILPIWNAIKMLHNPILFHFIGNQIPVGIIMTCVSLLVSYVLVIMLFFQFSQKASRNEQNVLMISNIFATLLGALVLIISLPVRRVGNSLESEILEECEHGLKTHSLFVTYKQLQSERKGPDCGKVVSVEACAGFVRTDRTDLLKSMEFNYRCSGWCSPPTLLTPTTAGQYAVGTQLLQTEIGIEVRQDRPSGKASRLWAFRDMSLRLPKAAEESPGTRYVYPPTLFSTLNFQATCDGMAARHIHFFLLDTADELYYQGVYLMVISIAIGFLKLLGFCMKDNIFSKMRKTGYGSMAYSSAPQRYVSQGVLQ